MPNSLNPQSACPLFNLPPELRNMIYSHTFTIPVLKRYGKGPRLRHDSARRAPSQGATSTSGASKPRRCTRLAILQTCKRINDEAAGMFYAIQKSICLDADAFMPNSQYPERGTITSILSFRRLSAIHSLEADIMGGQEFQAVYEGLSSLPALQRLKLKIQVCNAKELAKVALLLTYLPVLNHLQLQIRGEGMLGDITVEMQRALECLLDLDGLESFEVVVVPYCLYGNREASRHRQHLIQTRAEEVMDYIFSGFELRGGWMEPEGSRKDNEIERPSS